MRKRITITNHKPDCQDPFHCIALNSRKGKQTPKHHSSYCPSCDQYQKVDFTGGIYERISDTNTLKLTRKTRPKAFGNLDRKFSSEEVECIHNITRLTIENPTTTIYPSGRQWRNIDSPARTKEISNEEALSKKIKGLEYFYKQVILKTRCYQIGYEKPEDFGWDRKLVKRFLVTKPTKECLIRVFMGPNFLHEGFTASALPRKRRYEAIGYIINKGDYWGYMKPVDNETYIKILMSEIKSRNEVMKTHIKKKARQRRKKKILPLIYV